MKVSEVELMNHILDKYHMNLITIEWILRVRDNPDSTVSQIAKGRLDANNIRVGLRNRSLSDFIEVSPGKSTGLGRPASILRLNERGENVCRDLAGIIRG